MSEEKKHKKKKTATKLDAVKGTALVNADASVGTIPISASTSILNNLSGLAYGTHSFDGRASALNPDYLVIPNLPVVDTRKHDLVFTGTQLPTFSTQTERIGASSFLDKDRLSVIRATAPISIENRLLGMEIHTTADARNFVNGLSNYASGFASDGRLVNTLETFSGLASQHGKLVTDTMERLTSSSAAIGLPSHTEHYLKTREAFGLSESVTKILAFGQAAQTQFNTVTGSEIFKNGMTALGEAATTMEKMVKPATAFMDSTVITSPYIFAPKTVDSTELLDKIPQLEEGLAESKKEATKFFERVQEVEKEAQNKDQKIESLGEKVESQGEEIKSLQQEVEGLKENIKIVRAAKFVSSMMEDFEVGQLSSKNGLVYYGVDHVHFPRQEREICLLLMQASKERDSFVPENIVYDSIRTRKGLSHENMLKLVSNVRTTLRDRNRKIEIKTIEGEGFMMILNDIR